MKMDRRARFLGVVMIVFGLVSTVGCESPSGIRDHVDRQEARAGAERPVSTEVVLVTIPFDSARPVFVVTVEPFVMAASGVTSGISQQGGVINPGEQIGPGVAAQLISSLQRVGNVRVIDYATYARDPDRVAASLKNGEQGPFIIKGAVTEFSETADASGQGESTGPSFVLGIIPYVGGIASYAHGTRSASETKRIGMVALDVQVIDPKSGRLLASFTSEGSFTAVSTTKTRTTWGNTKTNVESASSAIGQAQRMALNKTITQIHALFSRQPLFTEG